uniref:C-type lectin domain-containing protein n=1 Tax=Dicentrarchus labrax TaxID=13489 RepID=A0A8C4DLJ0_DICLA
GLSVSSAAALRFKLVHLKVPAHGTQCYYFFTNNLTWNESRDECRQKGGDLVQIDSREEQVKHTDKFWIGLTDSEKEGTWLWVDGSPLKESLTFWSGKEPDNWTERDPDGEDCVRMGEKARAHDLKCWFDQSCKVKALNPPKKLLMGRC